MAPALQLRFLGRANTLNRSADQSERAMERRRRSQYPGLPLGETAGPPPNAVDHTTDAGGPCDTPPRAVFDALSDMALYEAAIAAGVAEAANDQTATRAPATTRAATALPANSTDVSPAVAPTAAHASVTTGSVPTPNGGPVFDPVQHPASTQRREHVMLREIAASWVAPGRSADAPR